MNPQKESLPDGELAGDEDGTDTEDNTVEEKQASEIQRARAMSLF